jgi:hypothetical protein
MEDHGQEMDYGRMVWSQVPRGVALTDRKTQGLGQWDCTFENFRHALAFHSKTENRPKLTESRPFISECEPRRVPCFCSGATISTAIPRFFNSRDPRISIGNQLREASPQIYKSRTKEKIMMLENE